MTEHNDTSGAGEQTLAERLAPMTIAEIDAMSDHDVAEIMGVTPEEFAAEPAWTWREAAKAATDELHREARRECAVRTDTSHHRPHRDPPAPRRPTPRRQRQRTRSFTAGAGTSHHTHPQCPRRHRGRPRATTGPGEPRRSRRAHRSPRQLTRTQAEPSAGRGAAGTCRRFRHRSLHADQKNPVVTRTSVPRGTGAMPRSAPR